MPVRIMHVVDSLAIGGLQNGLSNLIRRLDPTRFEHVVCAMRRTDDRNAQTFPADRTRLMCLDEKEKRGRSQLPALVRAIREVRPQILHSRNWAGVEAVLAARWVRGCAVVHSEHGIDSHAQAGEPWRRSCLRRLAFELADRVLSVSHSLRELHSARTGFPAHKITVIHNGVDTDRFAPKPLGRARIREELALTDQDFCIGCVGNLFPVKDHITVLRALASLNPEGGRWRLLMVGEGPELGMLQNFINAHPTLGNHVQFLGSSNRVPELLNAMDVYVLPSLIEGLSNSLLEAMATGLPVIATATGGNPEVAVDDESGLLFPVGDFRGLAERLTLVRTRPDLRRKLAQRALLRVREQFSTESMIGNYEQLYAGLGAKAGAAPIRVAAGT